LRNEIREEINSIIPFDEQEKQTIRDIKTWIDSGAELCRLKKPATPPQHLVSYFVVIDLPYILLVDHKNAQLWLPSGGHVDVGEHPKTTVSREANEELGLESKFLFEKPIFLTSTKTVGITAGHTDVSLWYVLKGNRKRHYKYDKSEFNDIQWFHEDMLPYGRTDPELERFKRKLTNVLS